MSEVILNTAVFGDRTKNEDQYNLLSRIEPSIDISGVQVRGELFSNNAVEELNKIIKLCEKRNWKLLFSAPTFLWDEFQINPLAKKYLDLVLSYNFISELKFSMGPYGSIQKLSNQLIDLFKSVDIQIDIENPPTINGNLNNVEQTLNFIHQQSINVGFCFDSGNWRWINVKSDLAFDQLKSYIDIFHLKNVYDKQNVLLNEKGEYDWQKMVQYCQLNNIPIVMEYGMKNEEELKEQLNILNSLLKFK